MPTELKRHHAALKKQFTKLLQDKVKLEAEINCNKQKTNMRQDELDDLAKMKEEKRDLEKQIEGTRDQFEQLQKEIDETEMASRKQMKEIMEHAFTPLGQGGSTKKDEESIDDDRKWRCE